MIRTAISLFAVSTVLSACVTAQTEADLKPQPSDDLPPIEIEMEAEETIGGPDYSLEAISPEPGRVQVGLSGSDPADIARYLLARGAGGASLSPGGEHVAFRYSVTGVPQLWITRATGGAPQQLTFGNGITFFRWMPDGSGLIYGADNDGNEQESYYFVSADGSEERLLLPAVEGGFRSFGDISADGSSVVFASTERNGLDFDIYKADLTTGDTEMLFEGSFGFFARGLSPDGKHLIIAETVGEDSDNLYLMDVDSKDMTTISAPEPRANHSDGGFAWLPDSSGFYFASNVDREFSAVHFYDVAAEEFSVAIETERDAGGLELCGAEGGYLAFTENVDGFHTLHMRDLATGETVETPSLPEGVHGVSCAPGSDRVAIRTNGWRTPGEVRLWDMQRNSISRTFEPTYAGLDPDRFVRPESIRIPASDGVELQGLLYLPDEASRKGDGPPPVLFIVHGGPTAQSMATFDAVVQYHVDRGIAVFEPNVRGSTGFGRTYVTLDDQEKRRDSVRDLIDMAAYLREDGRVDMDRATVAGGSYGGYMVNAVLALYPDSFAAGVSLFGVADWVTALQIASPALQASDRIEYGDIREQKWIDYYTENSPIRLADQIKVPVLYSHGVRDPRIDIYETEVMVKTLRANGIDAPYIRIEDEGHGWRKLSNRLFYYRAQAEFLEEVFAE
ncbi:MAG: prolyl oligopeptidase family serine peptidase [Hyphomonadaceae bacterium]|nr:prolyl oligopeptidase family serine peptidase [Hyphomonadaceae bacterium]